jgi:hypothetical protein
MMGQGEIARRRVTHRNDEPITTNLALSLPSWGIPDKQARRPEIGVFEKLRFLEGTELLRRPAKIKPEMGEQRPVMRAKPIDQVRFE